ncbi:hypothetical protein DERP_006215 [Dermatophagoides pteronyssinus]|uniref:Proline-rich protein PRCC-like n=1 Tax=Dermatophagoides pteronyssinus TaxID=6956 RepID=A0ABQ8IXS9_DERPT|nr:hypothetical protein DERP_006215 [Dermatophagoides pteronyssinus]
MSLVNYGYSDDDDDDGNDKNESDVISKTLPIESNEKKSTIDHSIANDEIKSIRPSSSSSTLSSSLTFKHLTKSNSRIQIKAFDDNLALMNQQPNGLVDSDDSDDDDDDDNRARKRMKRSEKGSSLISMLPKPKNAKTISTKSSTINEPTTSSLLTSLVPNSVSNRAKVSSLTSKLKPAKNENNSNFFFADPDNDDDDDDDENGDHIKMIPKPWIIEDNKDDVLNPVVATAPTLYHQAEEEETSSFAPIYGPSKPIEQEEEEVTYIDPNDDITYKKLIASKFDDNVDNIRIVDVNVQKHLSENKDWLKNISLEKDTVDEALESKAPNSTAKRKNQITFLAYQAKKRELELKNQWAQNRLSKSQTRAKYGF